MNNEIAVLSITAASLGFFHTLFGPDHYVPFIAMAKAGEWSRLKMVVITFLCGLGHVLSSVILGIIGLGLGVVVNRLELFEQARGNYAAWALIAFGLVYCVWGIRKAISSRPHQHRHAHEDGSAHVHDHVHRSDHLHVHKKQGRMTPWVLLVIFVLGPCEPLIPLLMYPAAKNSIYGSILVAGIFSAVTVATMVGVVLVLSFGLNLVKFRRLEQYSHAIAGASVFFCGVGIQFLGL